jgi:predicted permease
MTWDSFQQDIRYALRTFRRDPDFFTAAILIVGLGIGSTTAIFSVVNGLLFQPLRFPASDRLVWIANTGGDGGLSSVTSRVRSYSEWKRLNQSFEDLAAYFAFFDYGTYNLTGVGEPERLIGVGVSQNFLPFLGVQLHRGRNFSEEESKWNGPPAVILTHGLWQRRFGADPNLVGKSLVLNDRATTVAGVLPPTFDFSTVFTPGSPVDMIVPFPITPETDRWGNTLAVLGRLKPGVSLAQAQAEMNLLSEQIFNDEGRRWRFGARLTDLQEHLTGRFRRGLFILLSAVGAVLLIACTNLSNLLLTRAASRRKEVAIRSALGAGRARLIRQMLTESILLSVCGAILGTGVAFVAIRLIASIRSVSIPLLATVHLDAAALLLTAAAAFLTGILFGIVPAMQASGSQDVESLKDTGRGLSEGRQSAWTRSALVVSEIALACVLLVGAGLLMRSFLHVLDVDLGFRPQSAAAWRIEAGPKYRDRALLLSFYDRLVRSVEAVPGVESAGLTDALPLSRDRSWGIGVRGVQYPPGQYPIAHPRMVDHGYLPTMRIPLIAGRHLTERDTATSERVVVLNEKAARVLFRGEEAIGKMVRILNNDVRVTGVVGNVRHQSVEQEGSLEIYLPITQAPQNSAELVVRTRAPIDTVAPGIRAALRSVDASLPTAQFTPLTELLEKAVSPRRFLLTLLGLFALAAVALAAIGIYGVVSYNVAQRIQEIGIRMALGASSAEVRQHVMGRTVLLASCGIAIGVIGAFALVRLTESLLFGLKPTDPLTFAATIAALLAIAVLAGFLPALRASRVDPIAALRTS